MRKAILIPSPDIYRNLVCKYDTKYEIECEIIFRGNKNTQAKLKSVSILVRFIRKKLPKLGYGLANMGNETVISIAKHY